MVDGRLRAPQDRAYGARDLHLAVSRDGGRTFDPAAKLGRGTWKLEACPMDGGALAGDGRGGLVSAWRREEVLYLARPGQPEERLGAGRDPVVAATPEGIWAAPCSRPGSTRSASS